MSNDLFTTGGGLVVFALVTLLWHRRRSRSLQRASAGRNGWTLDRAGSRILAGRLRSLSLMQVGHSRRVDWAFRTADRLHVFSYTCETGFEHRRRSHRWQVVAAEKDHDCGRALSTTQDWLIAVGAAPCCHELRLEDRRDSDADKQPSRVLVAEDVEEWSERLRCGLREWLAAQPAERSWEVLPGLVVGYEPGDLEEQAAVRLAEAARELVRRLQDRGP